MVFYGLATTAGLKWYPLTTIGNSGVVTPDSTGSATFSIPPGPIGISVFGATMPMDGSGPGILTAFFATVGAVSNGSLTLSGYNFPIVPPSGWGITQLNPTTSITINVVMSGGGGM